MSKKFKKNGGANGNNLPAATPEAATIAATAEAAPVPTEVAASATPTASVQDSTQKLVTTSVTPAAANVKRNGTKIITTNEATIEQLPKDGKIIHVVPSSNGSYTVTPMEFKTEEAAAAETKSGGRRSKKTRKQKKNRKQKTTKGRRRH